MFIAGKHTISNPDEFWSRAKASLPNLPDGIKIHSVLPNDGMDDAICLWEANSLAQLTEYLEGKTGDVSHNHYIPVNETNAMGLPK
ncbi:MAG: hypothetical protein M3R17_19850 [Bacteroidota bacterium]|nr:hypothetical protein [Bacteroidota bacterium]